jgi:hypothetical protein
MQMMRRGDTAPATDPQEVEMTTFLPALDKLPIDTVPIEPGRTAGDDAPTVQFYAYALPQLPNPRAASAGSWSWFKPADEPESGRSTVLDDVNDIAGDPDSSAFMDRVLKGLGRL